MAAVNISPINAFKDNYVWAINNATQAVVVDPGDAAPVLEYLNSNKLQLVAILLTHHHADHIAGVPELLNHYSVPVYGPNSEFITSVTNPVVEGGVVNLPAVDLQLKVMEIPAHTLDHIAYYNDHSLFSGDTLFTGGCGRVFEGTPAQMLHALQRLSALDPQTLVYCGHEYTVNNLRFAVEVEPGNHVLVERLARAEQQRALGKPTVPATMADELATNPFLRTNMPAVSKSIEQHYQTTFNSPVEIFAALREWKNNF